MKRGLLLILFAVLAVSIAQAGSVVRVMNCADDGNWYTSKTCTFSPATTPGNGIIVVAWAQNSMTAISGGGNTWNPDITSTFGGAVRYWSVPNAASTGAVTITISASSRVWIVSMIEVSGGVSAAWVDRTSTRDNGYKVQNWNSGTTTSLSQASEFAVGFAFNGTGSTTLTEDATWTRQFISANSGAVVATKQFNATTGIQFSGTSTGGTDYQIYGLVATYKDAAAGPTNRGATETLTLTDSATAPGPTLWEPSQPINLILDSDLAENVDDMADQAMAHALMANGELNLVAVTTSSDNTYSAPCAKAIARYYHHNGVMIGAYQGNAFGGETSSYTQQVAARFGAASETRASYPDAVTVLRQALASIPDGTGVILSGGYFVNLRGLLDSPADGISALTGSQLISAKVRLFVCACGNFPSGTEHNLSFDPANASYVLANWPGQIVYSGFEIGTNVTTAPPVASSGTTNALRYAWDCYYNACNAQPTPTATGAWSQVAMLYAIRGKGTYFTTGGYRGNNTVNATTGANSWAAASPAGTGHASYLASTSYASMATAINTLLAQPPPARRRIINP